MPTASKLVGAVLFAALAWFISDLAKPLLVEGTRVGLLSPVNAAFGGILGWRLMGRGTGQGMRTALGYGLTTALMTAFWALLFWSAYVMVVRSTRLYYNGPTEAVQDMFALFYDYASTVATGEVIGSLLIGAMIFGWLTEMVSRRFP